MWIKHPSTKDEAVKENKTRITSYFDKDKVKQITYLKKKIYFSFSNRCTAWQNKKCHFQKLTQCWDFTENMGVLEIKYFKSRLEETMWKTLILMAEIITYDLAMKIKQSDIFALLTDEISGMSNISQLISLLKYFVLEKGLLILLLVSIFWVINLQLFNLSCHVDNPCSGLTKMFNQLNLGSKPKSIFFRRGFHHDSFLRWCRNEIKFKPEDSCITQLVSITQNIYNVLCNTWTTYSRG